MHARSLFALLAPVVVVVGCAQSDAGITTSIKARLAADDSVKAREINVDTQNRVVTLAGTVRSAEDESKALQIARSTEGVTNVIDNIAVASRGEQGTMPTSGRVDEALDAQSPEGAAVTDAGLTARVKTKLLADPSVGGLKIDVDTRDRVVTLTGTVESNREKARAVQLAGQIRYVARVEDRLTVRARSK